MRAVDGVAICPQAVGVIAVRTLKRTRLTQ